MTIDVLVFGIAREIVGKSTAAVELDDGITVALLKEKLGAQYPGIGRLSSFAIAVNGVYAAADACIRQGDEVAVIPPVSGG